MTTSEVSVSAVDLRELRAGLLAAGLGGRAFTKAYAEAVDEWLGPLFAAAVDGRGDEGVALLAVGGYGRAELCPASDLDLVLVHERGRSVAGVAEAIWYPVWDAGFHLDHSVRTPKEMKWRLEEGESFLREVMSRGKVLYEIDDQGMGTQSRSRLSRRQDGCRN